VKSLTENLMSIFQYILNNVIKFRKSSESLNKTTTKVSRQELTRFRY